MPRPGCEAGSQCDTGHVGYNVTSDRCLSVNLKALKYFCNNHGDQKVNFNLKSSQMS